MFHNNIQLLARKYYNMPAPATFKVWFLLGTSLAVIPLHCTTIPFSLVVAVNIRVEVMSATVPPVTAVGLEAFVRVATKVMLLHCGGKTPLQSTLLPMGVLPSTNRIQALPEINGSTIQSRAIACVTVQV